MVLCGRAGNDRGGSAHRPRQRQNDRRCHVLCVSPFFGGLWARSEIALRFPHFAVAAYRGATAKRGNPEGRERKHGLPETAIGNGALQDRKRHSKQEDGNT